MRKSLVAVIAILGGFTSVAWAVPEFDVWVEEVAQDWVKDSPMTATSSQYLPPAEQAANDRLLYGPDGNPAVDQAARRARVAKAAAVLEGLKRWSVGELTPAQRASYGVIQWQFKNLVSNDEAWEANYVFDQRGGAHVSLVNFLSQTHPIRRSTDVEAYLARLDGIAAALDRATFEARRRGELGILPPKFIVEATIRGIDRFLEGGAPANVLVTSLRDRIGRAAMPEAEVSRSLALAEKTVVESVIPAYRRIRALLVEQLAFATDQVGFSSLPGGRRAYELRLRNHTTTMLTADEIHEIGLSEVDRLEKEMNGMFRELGDSEGTIAERVRRLNIKAMPPADPDPRLALLAEINRIVRQAERLAPAFFDLLPNAPIEVRREPSFTEAAGSARYSAPAPDGSRPGIYWVSMARLDEDATWLGVALKSVTFHEAIPGHHYQLTLQQELSEVPRFRKYRIMGGSTAFSEGWGLYAERLADEAGWYEGDLVGRIGYLSEQLYRARRLVVDTGLHTRGWTRQQAIDYGQDPAEVDRYVVNPGQACAYMIGYLKIVELRERAKTKLGDKFALKQYHNLLLRTGTVPLDVLEQVVDEWIASQA